MDSLFDLLILLSGAATFATMFGAALRLGPKALHRVKEHPRLFLRTFAAVWLVIPLFTAVVIYKLGVVGTSATLLLLMSVCPGSPVLLTTMKFRPQFWSLFTLCFARSPFCR